MIGSFAAPIWRHGTSRAPKAAAFACRPPVGRPARATWQLLGTMESQSRWQQCIRSNDPWRICFIWRDGDAYDAAIVDYHQEPICSEKVQPDPIHPSEILCEDFHKPLGMSINRLTRDLNVSPNRISLIVNGARAVSADTALRLRIYSGVSSELWLNLRTDYGLRRARKTRAEHIQRRVTKRSAPWTDARRSIAAYSGRGKQ
jgi:addiction module HigA family antidote